jgi:hypothetical protein
MISGQQAREWLGIHILLCFASKLASNYGSDDIITTLLNNFVIYIIPLVNPDGYVYTWTEDRMWRKNRRLNADSSYGVDLNKNWDSQQWGVGGSAEPSSETYFGTEPFSEPETSCIRNFVSESGPYAGALDFGSYGQLVLLPDNSTSQDLCSRWANDISTASQQTYTCLPANDVYTIGGTFLDWCYSFANIDYSLRVLPRDMGSYGYLVPVSSILPTCTENYAAFINYLTTVLSLN